MKWKIELETKAKKQIRKFDRDTQIIILKYIHNKILKNQDPYILGKALTGKMKGYWRYRVNKYRIVCKIKDDILTVVVFSIAKRDIIYEIYED